MMENPRTVAFVLKKALPYDATLYIQFGPKIPSLEGSLKTTEPFQVGRLCFSSMIWDGLGGEGSGG